MGKRPDDGATCAGKGAMGGGGLRAPSKLRPTRRRDLGPCPTKGLCYSLPELEASTDDGASVDQRRPHQGAGGWWEAGVSTDDGASVDQRMPQQGASGWWEVGAGTDDGARNVWA